MQKQVGVNRPGSVETAIESTSGCGNDTQCAATSQVAAPLQISGIDLSGLSTGMQQALLGVIAFLAIGASSLAQEYAINVLDFRHSVVFTAAIPFATAGLGALFGGLSRRKAPFSLHLLCGVLAFATFELSNMSPIYNNYPTHMICKSAKILPTMALGILMLGKTYVTLEFIAAALLIAGLAVFLQADAAVTPNFEPFGIGIVAMALACDAFMSNVQERMFRTHGCTQNEMAAWTMGIALLCSTGTGLATGTYADGFAEVLDSPPIALCVLAFAAGNYLTTLVILTMIGRFGAASTVFTTSVCKAASMGLSFLIMPKAATVWHLLGVVLVGIGVYANMVARKQHNEMCGRSDDPDDAGGVDRGNTGNKTSAMGEHTEAEASTRKERKAGAG